VYALRKRSIQSGKTLASYVSLVLSFLRDKFYENIPSDGIKELPAAHAFPLGLAAYVILTGTFLAFFLTGYLNDRNEKFLAVTKSAGDCNSVSKPISGTYLADYQGYWEGSADFNYNNAIYVMYAPQLDTTQSEYVNALDLAFSHLDEIAALSYTQSLAINLLYWMSWSGSVQLGSTVSRFGFTGSPSVVFDRGIYYASFSDQHSTCPVHPVVTYNSANSRISLQFDYAEFKASTECMSVINPEHIGYSTQYSGKYFNINIDAQTIITALSVNLGVISVDDLEPVPNTAFIYVDDGVSYNLGEYFYPLFPGMVPLFCMNSAEGLLCTIEYFEVYLYPVFNSLGNSLYNPEYCNCSTQAGTSFECNLFQFLAGFVFYDYSEADGESRSDAIGRLIDFSVKQGKSGGTLNRDAYNASFDAVHSKHENSGSKEWRQSAYDFCTLSGSINCSMLTLLLSDSYLRENSTNDVISMPKYSVSSHYYSVPFGSCNNTFTIPLSAQRKLKSIPPEPLTESYFECRNEVVVAINNAFGIAMGNTSAALPVVVFLVLSFYVLYSSARSIEAPRTYSSGERSDALDFLAFNMLLARDKRYKGDPDGVLMKLTNELVADDSVSRFYYVHMNGDKKTPDIEMTELPGKGRDNEVKEKECLSPYDVLVNPLHVTKDD